jgi:hypothetical protein
MSDPAPASTAAEGPPPPPPASPPPARRAFGLRRWLAWLCLDRPAEVRPCPHCEATIPESSNVCPRCRRVLRFEGIDELRRAAEQARSSP